MLKSNLGGIVVANESFHSEEKTLATSLEEAEKMEQTPLSQPNERRKATKASVICTSIAYALALVFAALFILYAINIGRSGDAGEAIGGAISFIILVIYAGAAVALAIIGLSTASIVTSSLALKSTNAKYRKTATTTLILSIILILAAIACTIYVLLAMLGA